MGGGGVGGGGEERMWCRSVDGRQYVLVGQCCTFWSVSVVGSGRSVW